ncbi:MAG: SGNH/GDSL hydrolase family protein [Solobacterium sp.]|nr:SGNH/GDSL hydrolase family protein [Solobacterium sp.]
MKRFIRTIAVFLLTLVLLVSGLCAVFFALVPPEYERIYTQAMVDKVARLHATEGPRIVLVGNSNLAFGINSPEIEETFGIPVVNMGMHGGFGNAFDEQVCTLDVHEGDIYVIAHNTYSDDDMIPNPELVWMTIENYPELHQLIRRKDYMNMARAFPRYAFKATVKWVREQISGHEVIVDGTDGFMSRAAFNEYGDDVYPRPENDFLFTEGSVPLPQINDLCVNRLNALNAELVQKGARMVIAAYPIGDGEFTPAREEYEAFQKELAERLDAEVISDFTDYFYDYSLFFDSNLHLTDAGAEMRTQQLIQDLKKVIQPAGTK